MRYLATAVTAMALTVCGAVGTTQLFAQDGNGGDQPRRQRGGPEGERRFDPEQMRQRMIEALKERLGTDEEEWQVMEPKITRLVAAQQELRAGGMRGGPGGPGGPGGRGGEGQEPENASELAKAASSLRETLRNEQAPAEEITKNLEAFRAAREKAETELQAAREDLKGIVTARQEATLVMMGMLE